MKNISLKRCFLSFLCLTLLCFGYGAKMAFSTSGTKMPEIKKVVLVTQIVEHPALNAVRQGLQDVLTKNATESDIDLKIVYENAQGSIPLAGQLARKFSAEKADAIVAISTPSAQTLKTALRGTTPLVFTALTDPIAAKLVKNMKVPGNNITGVTDLPPFDQQMAFIKAVVPGLKRLGILYNPGEANAVASLAFLKEELTSLGIQIVSSAVNRSSEVSQATKRLLKDVDAIYIPNDNTVVSGLDAAVKICHEAQIPLFAADILLVERGLVGMIGFDYYAIGQQTGAMVQRILNGEDAGSIAVENPTNLKLILNSEAAKKMSVSFSENFLKKADTL